MVGYFGRDGRQCQKVEWDRLRSDRDYRIVREYQNDQVHVVLEWMGYVNDVSIFRDCWNMFVLQVMNRNSVDQWKPDPVEHGKWFGFEADGIKAYEEFLERWTASHRNDDGEFVEEDNDLAPPPPPNPDAPATAATSVVSLGDDDVGAW